MPSLVVTAPGNLTEEEQAICEVFFTLPYSTPLNLTRKMYENSLRLWWIFGRQYVIMWSILCRFLERAHFSNGSNNPIQQQFFAES